MALLKIKIWDRHEAPVFIEGEERYLPKPNDDEWKKFYYYIETDQVRIESFREYVIWDKEDTPQPCVKIYFSDKSYVLGRYSLDAWIKRYNDVYVPMIPKDLHDIIEDLKPPE